MLLRLRNHHQRLLLSSYRPPHEYFEATFGGPMASDLLRRANLRSVSIVGAFAGLHAMFHSSYLFTSLASSSALSLQTLPDQLAEPGSVPHQLVHLALSPAWNFLGMATGVVLWYANAKYARSLVSHIAILPNGLVKMRAHEFWGKPSATEAVYLLKDFRRVDQDATTTKQQQQHQLVYKIGDQKFIFDHRDKRMESLFHRAYLAEKQPASPKI